MVDRVERFFSSACMIWKSLFNWYNHVWGPSRGKHFEVEYTGTETQAKKGVNALYGGWYYHGYHPRGIPYHKALAWWAKDAESDVD